MKDIYNEMAPFTPKDLLAFELSNKAVDYREKPFKLRAGGESHWYVELRRELAHPRVISLAGGLMIHRARDLGWKYERIAGLGIGGRFLMYSTLWAHSLRHEDMVGIEGNDDKSSGQRYGYGLHGGDAKGKKVFIVDDTATTGDSLITLTDMIYEADGEVVGLMSLVDRSGGAVAERLGKMGLDYTSIFEFSEATGKITTIAA